MNDYAVIVIARGAAARRCGRAPWCAPCNVAISSGTLITSTNIITHGFTHAYRKDARRPT